MPFRVLNVPSKRNENQTPQAQPSASPAPVKKAKSPRPEAPAVPCNMLLDVNEENHSFTFTPVGLGGEELKKLGSFGLATRRFVLDRVETPNPDLRAELDRLRMRKGSLE